jgi:hypothetical protein
MFWFLASFHFDVRRIKQPHMDLPIDFFSCVLPRGSNFSSRGLVVLSRDRRSFIIESGTRSDVISDSDFFVEQVSDEDI